MLLLVEIAGHVEVREARFENRDFKRRRPTTEAWRKALAADVLVKREKGG
jgi:hypothetical protein